MSSLANSPPRGKTPRETYHLTLTALAGDPRPGDVRMRAALKLLLRACYLRCTRIVRDDGREVSE
jgi:hypothetical protein